MNDETSPVPQEYLYCSREPLRKGNRMQVILNLKTLLHQDHIFGVNYLVVTLREEACRASNTRGCC